MNCIREHLFHLTRSFSSKGKEIYRIPKVSDWELPAYGYYIGNFDGSVFDDFITCGGLIRRDDGTLVKGVYAKFPHHPNSTVAELYGLELVLVMAKNLNIEKFRLETDNNQVDRFMGRPLNSYKDDIDPIRMGLLERTSELWSGIDDATRRLHTGIDNGNQSADHLCRFWKEMLKEGIDVYKPDLCNYFHEPWKVPRLDQFLQKDLEGALKRGRW